jgi:hypothetical protein
MDRPSVDLLSRLAPADSELFNRLVRMDSARQIFSLVAGTPNPDEIIAANPDIFSL